MHALIIRGSAALADFGLQFCIFNTQLHVYSRIRRYRGEGSYHRQYLIEVHSIGPPTPALLHPHASRLCLAQPRGTTCLETLKRKSEQHHTSPVLSVDMAGRS
jgi:hypothetical protein